MGSECRKTRISSRRSSWAQVCNIQAGIKIGVQLAILRITRSNLLQDNIGNLVSKIQYKTTIRINRCWNSNSSRCNHPLCKIPLIWMRQGVHRSQVVWVSTNKLRFRTDIPSLSLLYPTSSSAPLSRAFTRSKSSYYKTWEKTASGQETCWVSSCLVRILPISIYLSTCRIHNSKLASSGRLPSQKGRQTFMATQSEQKNKKLRFHLKMLMFKTVTNSLSLPATIHSWCARQWKGGAGG